MEPEPAPEPAPERNTSTRARTASAGGKLVHVPSAPSALPLGAAKDGAAKIGTTKRRGTTEVIFEGSDMQAAVAALALVDSSDEEPPEASPEASPRAKGRPRSRSASFANEAVVDFRVTPSLQRTLDTLERIGLGRHKTMFLRERITFDTLGVLVEDDAKLAELGLAMGERLRLHKELRPAPAAQPELAPALRRPVRRNSFDRWYGEVEAEETPAGDLRVDQGRAAAFIGVEYEGFQGSAIIENIEDIQLGSFIAEGTSGGVRTKATIFRGGGACLSFSLSLSLSLSVFGLFRCHFLQRNRGWGASYSWLYSGCTLSARAATRH